MGNCIGNIMSNVIYFSEKFSMFLSFSMLISCSVICMVCMLAFGVGLGYNYSYVDFRSKHVYVPEHYKKVRPTNYLGPGHYKPTTRDPRYTRRKTAMREKIPQRWWDGKRRARDDGQESDVVEFIHEKPEDLPGLSPVAMVEDVIAPQIQIKPDNRVRNKLEGLYFTTPKVKLRQSSFMLPHDDSTTVVTTEVSSDTPVDKHDIKEKISHAPNESDVNVVNATKHIKEPDSIPVNVTKTRDSAPPYVLKTMMHQDQLMKWLSRLQDANKTFAVHVITD